MPEAGFVGEDQRPVSRVGFFLASSGKSVGAAGSVTQEPSGLEYRADREKRSFLEDAMRGLADKNRQTFGNLSDKAPVILMPVRDYQGEKGFVWRTEAGDVGKRDCVVSKGIEGSAHVEHDSRVTGLDLDTASAHLFGTAVDSDPHRSCQLPENLTEKT